MFIEIAIIGLLLALSIARLFRLLGGPITKHEPPAIKKPDGTKAKSNSVTPTLRQRSKARILDDERRRALKRRGIEPIEPGL